MANQKNVRKGPQVEGVLWCVTIIYRCGGKELTHFEVGTKAECQADYRQFFSSHPGAVTCAWYEHGGKKEVIV